MEFFDKLGALVGRLWGESRYDEKSFPKAACRALAELPPNEHVSFWDAVKLGFAQEPLIHQHDIDASFGQPPLTVYWGRDFHIEVLFWTLGLPGIHQHAFSGGFHVMHGSSLQTTWSFETEEAINSRLRYGQLSLKKAELLETGATRAIPAGSGFIHSTYHLDRPSVSVVVRTNNEPDQLPQYRYLFPTICYDDKHVVSEVRRRAQVLNMLMKVGKRWEFDQLIGHAFATADAYSIFHYLLEVYPMVGDEDDRQALLLRAKLRNRRMVEALEPTLYHLLRRRRIIGMRDTVFSTDLQFFLALLLNLTERRSFFKLINQRYTMRDPIEAVVGWLAALSDTGALGDMRFNESWLLMLRCLLSGLQGPEIEAAFREHFSLQDTPPGLDELAEAIRGAWLLQPLFSAETRDDKYLVAAGPHSRSFGHGG